MRQINKCMFMIMILIVAALTGCKSNKVDLTVTDESTIEVSTEDPYAVSKEFNETNGELIEIDKQTTHTESPEESSISAEIESREAESEHYVYVDADGTEQDLRVDGGLTGILKSIADKGGVETIATDYKREDLEHLWSFYVYASKEDMNRVLDIIYSGTAEDKATLSEEVLHTEAGWYQDENGNWKNAYDVANTNSAINFE